VLDIAGKDVHVPVETDKIAPFTRDPETTGADE
jgi:hypothetical protein